MRKKSGVKISFFAFQDIITSTTGILILITLILTFFLNQAAELGESDNLSDLQDKLAKMEESIAQTHDEISRLDKLLKDWGDVDPEKLTEEIKELQARLAALKGKIADLGEEQREALELAARLNIEQEKAKKLQMQLDSSNQKIADLRRKVKEAAAANILFPSISRQLVNKKLMLVVMAKGNHEVIEYGGSRTLKNNFGSKLALTTYLKGKPSPIAYHIVLFIKPSGIDEFLSLHGTAASRKRPSELNLLGYKYIGWDALDQDAELAIK
jgi:hypothetical protein